VLFYQVPIGLAVTYAQRRNGFDIWPQQRWLTLTGVSGRAQIAIPLC
jgi:hypothetical protein